MRLGIDIGGTKTAAVVLDRGGAELASGSTPSGRGARDVVAVAARLAREVMDEVGGAESLSSVGVCIPGLVDSVTGTVRHAVNLDVAELDLGVELGAALGRAVSVENDVKASALGAHHLSGLGSTRTRAYLNLGTGLAAAVVHRGEIVRGVDGVAGEIGHLPVGGDVACACGQTGCLETVASGSALERMWPAAADAGWDLFGAASRGDVAAGIAAASLCRGIALAVQLLVLASGAERVVVLGGLTALGEPLLDGVRDELRAGAAASSFLCSLALADRIELLTSDVPVAAIGAATLVPTVGTAAVEGALAWRS